MSEREIQERKAREIRWRRRQELAAVAQVLSEPFGRMFVWRILDDAAVFATSYVPGSPDQTAYNEGRRAIGLRLLRDLEETEPGVTLRLAVEAKERESRGKRNAGPDEGHAEFQSLLLWICLFGSTGAF